MMSGLCFALSYENTLSISTIRIVAWSFVATMTYSPKMDCRRIPVAWKDGAGWAPIHGGDYSRYKTEHRHRWFDLFGLPLYFLT